MDPCSRLQKRNQWVSYLPRFRSPKAPFRAMTDAPAGTSEPTVESLEVIRKFAETYAQRTGT